MTALLQFVPERIPVEGLLFLSLSLSLSLEYRNVAFEVLQEQRRDHCHNDFVFIGRRNLERRQLVSGCHNTPLLLR